MRILSRTYFSVIHLESAVLFAETCKGLEDSFSGSYQLSDYPSLKSDGSYALASVISAVGFLEATINEVFADSGQNTGELNVADSSARARIKVFNDQFNSSKTGPSVLNKYQLALACVTGTSFDRGRAPMQDVGLLIDLRNALVHATPETVVLSSAENTEERTIQKLEAQLTGKFTPNKFLGASGNEFFPSKCLGAGCAKWAVKSAFDMASRFFQEIGLEHSYEPDILTRIVALN